MAVDQGLIERIVNDVMRELRSSAGGCSCAKSPPQTAQSQPTRCGCSSQAPKEVVLAEPVITAEILQQHAAHEAGFVIAPQAVLTPSARDYLSAKKIPWRRQQVDNQPTGQARSTTWGVALCEAADVVSTALDGSNDAAAVFRRQIVSSADDALQWALAAIEHSEVDGAVIVASAAQRLACRANRQKKVRAAVVESAQSIAGLHRQLGANVYCIDPCGKSQFEWRNLLREIARCSRPSPPADWRE